MATALPEIGALAPDFSLPRDGGEIVTLSALRPAAVVLFFFPKANTTGCTTEARDFSTLLPDFRAAGVQVLGLSKDSVKRQENFVSKQDLAIPLLSDAEDDVCERYGVWGEKKMYGRTFTGITRTTVLIAGDGKVAQVWPRVKATGHAAAVLDAVRAR